MSKSEYDGIYKMTMETDGGNFGTSHGQGVTTADIEVSNGEVNGYDNLGVRWSGFLEPVDRDKVDLTLTMDPFKAGKEFRSMNKDGELTDLAQKATYTFDVKRQGDQIILMKAYLHGDVGVCMAWIKQNTPVEGEAE